MTQSMDYNDKLRMLTALINKALTDACAVAAKPLTDGHFIEGGEWIDPETPADRVMIVFDQLQADICWAALEASGEPLRMAEYFAARALYERIAELEGQLAAARARAEAAEAAFDAECYQSGALRAQVSGLIDGALAEENAALSEAAVWQDAGQCPLCSAPGTRASYDTGNDARVSYCLHCKVSILQNVQFRQTNWWRTAAQGPCWM